MLTLVVLLLSLTAATCFIAYWSDNLGKKLGKKRVTLGRLRPRQTATLIGMASSVGIMLLTLAVLLGTYPGLRHALLRYDETLAGLQHTREANRLQREANRQLQGVNEQYKRESEQLQRNNRAQQAALKQTQANAQRTKHELQRDIGVTRGQLNSARQSLNTAQSGEREARSGERQAQAQKAGAEREASNAEGRVQNARQLLGQTNARLTQTKARADQAGARAVAAEGRLAKANARLVAAQQAFARASRAYTRVARSSVEEAQRSVIAVERARAEVEAARAEVTAARTQAEAAGGQVVRARAAVAELDTQRATLEQNLTQLTQTYGEFAAGPGAYIASPEQVLATRTLPVGTSRDALKAAIDALLREGSEVARQQGAGEGAALEPVPVKANGNFYELSPDDLVRRLTDLLSSATTPVSLRLMPTRYHARGEPVINARFVSVPVKQAFSRGETLARAQLRPGDSDVELFKALQDLVEAGRIAAQNREVLPPLTVQKPNFFAPDTADQLFGALHRVQAAGRGAGSLPVVEVRLVAADDLSTAEPLRVRFEVGAPRMAQQGDAT